MSKSPLPGITPALFARSPANAAEIAADRATGFSPPMPGRVRKYQGIFYEVFNIEQTGRAKFGSNVPAVRLRLIAEVNSRCSEEKFRPQPVWNFRFGIAVGPNRQAGGLCAQGLVAKTTR
jgi:hypothetical protein